MAKKAKQPKRRSGIAVAMVRCHPRKQVFRHKNARRAGDAKKSWRREWD